MADAASLPAHVAPPARLGVTTGKFLPFHLGHVHLIDQASDRCDHLVVLVGDRPGQPYSGELRAEWIRAAHPRVDVRVIVDDLPEAPEPWARRTVEVLGRSPDVVFTSEVYGRRWAELMGAEHVAIDPDRRGVPVSGSQLRADLGRHWRFLPPAVRASLAPRVVVLGVESSGTTTLARDLAEHYRTVWAPEHGRWYWEGRRHLPAETGWRTDEFVRIARAQLNLIDDLAHSAHRLLVADTDGWATHVWHRRYVGTWSPEVAAVAASGRADLHLLTAPDFAFVQDGTRESEALRSTMHRWFVETIERHGLRYLTLTGDRPRRLAEAVAAVDQLIDFAPIPSPSPVEPAASDASMPPARYVREP